RSIAVSPKDGKLYVADASVQGACSGGCIWQVDPATGVISGAPVFVGTGVIEGVAFDTLGDNLYFTDRQDRTGRLTWNGTTYATLVTCNSIGGVLQDPYHLVFDPTLGLVTADGNDRSVLAVAPACGGTAATRITMADALDEPRGIALGPTGELYVSDRNRDRVSLVDRTTGALTAFSSAMREPYGTLRVCGDGAVVEARGVAADHPLRRRVRRGHDVRADVAEQRGARPDLQGHRLLSRRGVPC
ncbi:MAG: hypothetical protein NT062_33680, partial [Proteobacteria bacterium]|nr:hypothetical protein [Pseudomonadota bacterium]